jgi:tetratricopeptide (TPR) repeat protein
MIWGIAALILLLAATAFFFLDFDNPENTVQSTASIDAGVARFNEKNYDEALPIFEAVPDGDPQKWRALYYQGSSYIMLKDYQAAVEFLEHALTLNPTHTPTMHALGVAYFKLGNLKLSKAYFASVLAIEPGNEEAKGLMDIMANLERQQPTEDIPEPKAEKQP